MTQAGNSDLELIMREGVHPQLVVGKKAPPPPDTSRRRESGLHIERNVSVRLRDGVRIFVDIYRPDGAAGERDLPALLGWSPYGKHNTSDRLAWPAADVQRRMDVAVHGIRSARSAVLVPARLRGRVSGSARQLVLRRRAAPRRHGRSRGLFRPDRVARRAAVGATAKSG